MLFTKLKVFTHFLGKEVGSTIVHSRKANSLEDNSILFLHINIRYIYILINSLEYILYYSCI